MNDINKIFMSGRLVSDATVTEVGTSNVTRFRMAVNRQVPVRLGEGREDTKWEDKPMFINVYSWANFAKALAPDLKKGKQVFVEGHLADNSWKDADGKLVVTIEIAAKEIILGRDPGKKREETAPYSNEPLPWEL